MMSDNSMQESWLSTLFDEIKVITDSSIKEWGTLVNRLGMDEKNRLEWADTFKHEVQDLMKDLIIDVQQTQENLLNKIESLLKQSEDLCKKLSIRMPDYGSDNLGLYNEEQVLIKQVNELQEQVQKRIDELTILKNREEKVCTNLGKLPKSINESPLPSRSEIDSYIKYIKSLEEEQTTREKTFRELKAEILEVASELKLKPTLDFEKMVLGDNDNLFIYTDVNMSSLQSFYDSIIERKEHVASEIAQLRERVRSLWEILSEDIQVCNSFLENHPGNSLDTLEALQAEVKRCDDLKKANIKVFVEKLREEMQHLWDKCKFTPEQRTVFEYFHDDLYTEDLLTLHDMEIIRLKKYYEDNRDIYDLLEKREQLWSKMLELEERSTAPDRYKNRGGQLLKEEKERNALFKRIPKIEDKLLELTTEFEIKNGSQFLYWGETVEMVIKRCHENYENDKKVKLSARKQQRDLTITPNNIKRTPLKPTLPPNATPLKSNSSKRFLATPMSTTKRFKHMEEIQRNGTRTAPSLANKSITRTKLRYSTEKKKRIDKLRRLSKAMQKQKNSTASSTVTEYKVFEVELSHREACRSTLFEVAEKASNPVKLTPCKPFKPTSLHGPSSGTPIKSQNKFSTTKKLEMVI